MLLSNIEEQIQYDGIKQRILYKDDRFRIILLSIARDGEMSPHISTTDAFMTVWEGELVFNLEGKNFNLRKGDNFVFGARQMHSLKALQDTSVLITK